MTERPILFSAPMVRAILAGTKTQTRRAIRPQPSIVDTKTGLVGRDHPDDQKHGRLGVVIRCPYGAPGDRLWVREAWSTHAFLDSVPPRELTTRSIRYFADGGAALAEQLRLARRNRALDQLEAPDRLAQHAESVRVDLAQQVVLPGLAPLLRDIKTGKRRPGMLMPRWASRIITLEVTNVRVERLQDISEADAKAEGIVEQRGGGFGLPDGSHYHAIDPRISYWSLWATINGADSWHANPWVWVVAFCRIAP